MSNSRLKRKTILVTGGAGYLGSVLTGKLLDNGFRVRVLDRSILSEEPLSAYMASADFELITGDIRNRELVSRCLEGVYGVCHLAALVGEPACRINLKKTREINVLATEQLINLSKKYGVKRFVFTSTCSNYGITNPNEEADETFALRPLSAYSESKIEAEEQVTGAKNSKFYPTVMRFAMLFGISTRMRFSLFINEVVRDAVYGKEIVIYNSSAWRPHLSVQDAAASILAVLNARENLISGEIFNVVGENLRKKDVISIVKKRFPNVVALKRDEGSDSKDYKVSGNKIRKILSFKPRIKVESAIIEIEKGIKQGMFRDPYRDKHSL